MVSDSERYENFKKNLRSEEAKKELEENYQKNRRKRTEVERENIRRDHEHLKLVNACADSFYDTSFLRKETGYHFFSVEPLYGGNRKNFDVAIFGDGTLILVECKSSISERSTRNVFDEIEEKIEEVEENEGLIEKILDVDIVNKEYVLCSFASVFPRANLESQLKSLGIPVCLWSVNQLGTELWLKSLSEDTEKEIGRGRLHKDKHLRNLLRNSVKIPERSVRTVQFLPSSHSCVVLSAVSVFLSKNLDINNVETFHFGDLHAVIKNRESMKDFNTDQVSALTKNILEKGLEMKIINDESPDEQNPEQKNFSLTCRPGEVEEKYINTSADGWAKERAIEEYKAKQPSINSFSNSD